MKIPMLQPYNRIECIFTEECPMKAELINKFLKTTKETWENGFEAKSRHLLEEIMQFVDENRKPSKRSIKKLLNGKNSFICESFLRYIQKQSQLNIHKKKIVKKLISYIYEQEVRSADYDERIEVLGAAHAIKHYWEPEELVDRRRVNIISDAIRADKDKLIVDVSE